jgi:hypothetical protein
MFVIGGPDLKEREGENDIFAGRVKREGEMMR